ncbi:hypothetical protein DXG01_015154 [Tephrocybe rancida]|nr:hypothetical protein DXG01_015154 [Tephrocybe rancida]
MLSHVSGSCGSEEPSVYLDSAPDLVREFRETRPALSYTYRAARFNLITKATMVQIAPLLLFAGFIASSVSTPFKRTVAQVEADVAKISILATAFDNAIKSFASSGVGSLADALNTGPLSEVDARNILAGIEGFGPTIVDALTNIIDKKAAFEGLEIASIPGLIFSDLTNLNTSSAAACFNFEAELIGAAAVLLPEARQTQSIVTDAFNRAIAAYA